VNLIIVVFLKRMMLTLTNNDSQDHTSYINKFHAEAMFLVMGTQNDYGYTYVTFNKSKLRGFQRKSISKYNIRAWANIPITENGTVDMRLFIGKDNKIQEFTMQYRDHVKYKGILGMLNIRSDLHNLIISIYSHLISSFLLQANNKKRIFHEVHKKEVHKRCLFSFKKMA
jgi:hypothetical protein